MLCLENFASRQLSKTYEFQTRRLYHANQKIRGYLIKGNNPVGSVVTDTNALTASSLPIATTNNTTTNVEQPNPHQRLLCAIGTCLDYVAFNTILCDYHNAEADKACFSLDVDYTEPAANNDSDVVIPTLKGYTSATQHHNPNSLTKATRNSSSIWVYGGNNDSDGGDAA
jgi:hypothetical protein